MERKLFVFGNNQDGQLGISHGDDYSFEPREVSHVDADSITRIAMNQFQTFVVLKSGVLLSCGSNENNELGRSGKRSWLHRVDAIETFQVSEASLGSGFCSLLCDDGKVLSWGKNDLGQLGNGTRENKEKPRVNTTMQDALLQICCGATHTIALTKSGKVITWGGNRWGQLGDGQLTSSTKALVPLQLRHRPVVSITCGENHSMVMTIGGNVYSWGDNSQGQLGLSDTTNRLRPELIKALRSMGATKISAGRNHSLVISQSGLLLAFGSNNHGQCGVDSEVKIQPQPVVVERLRELRSVNVSGGFAHTLVLCAHTVAGQGNLKVFVMGLNSSGQLGLGHTTSVSTPTQLVLGQRSPIGIAAGPMSMHSAVFTGAGANPLLQLALPSVHYDKVATSVNKYLDNVRGLAPTSTTSASFVKVREMVSAAFSSIPVLNASFLLPAEKIGHGSLCIDLKAVRGAYDLLMLTEVWDSHVVATLGRATLHLADQLKECPVDDAENLSVFLIVLENPLMLRASSFHVAIETVIRSILSVPKYYRLILFKWLKSYPSEYFSRVLQVLQGFLSLILRQKSLNLDPTPVIMVLETLYQCNVEEKIVPEHLFYNDAIPATVNLHSEWMKYRAASFDSNVFNYCSYPFLIHEYHKLQLLLLEFKNIQDMQAVIVHRQYPITDHLRHRIQLLAAATAIIQCTAAPPAASSLPDVHTGGDDASPMSTPASTQLPTPPSAPSPSTATPPHTSTAPSPASRPVPNLTSAAVDELIERAGPGVFDFIQSSAEGIAAASAARLPPGLAVSYDIVAGVVSNVQLGLKIEVSRNRLLADLIETLDAILDVDHNILMLPLKVTFKGEMGVDYGGIKREFFTNTMKEIISHTSVLAPCSNGRLLWFTNQSSTFAPASCTTRKVPRLDHAADVGHSDHSEPAEDTSAGNKYADLRPKRRLAYYLGLVVGMAAYNGVHVDVPLPSCVYKTMKGLELTLADLWAADSSLAAGLQALLSFQEGTGMVEEVFGVTFTASANPLLGDFQQDAAISTGTGMRQGDLQSPRYVALCDGSADVSVSRSNRHLFVKGFITHALYGSAAGEVDLYIKGLKTFLHPNTLAMCSAAEVEHILCGSKEIGDLSELRLHTTYQGAYTDRSPVIQWFWDMLSALPLPEKRKFLHFVTGSERVPLGGLSNLKLTIQSTGQAESALPTSHTCFNVLNIPTTYSSLSVLRARFAIALEHHQGFGLV